MANKSRNDARLHRHQRVRKNVYGTTARPRLNIYKSSAEIYAQVIDDEAGKTIISASTIDVEIRKSLKGLKKSEQARKVGSLLADRAKQKGIKEVVFDRGGFRFMGRVKALADGAREGGLVF